MPSQPAPASLALRNDVAVSPATVATEHTERRHRTSLVRLNEIAALTHLPFDEQIREALRLGAAHLGLEFGILSLVEDTQYTILAQVSPAGTLEDGQAFELGDTFCSLTLASDHVVAIDHVAESDHRGHPCYRQLRLEAYIGAPIVIDDSACGTVNFSSPAPCTRGFDESDHEFMALLARWISAALQREQLVRRLAESEEHLRTIVETAPVCLKLVDAGGTVIQINRAGLQILGAHAPDQVIGRSLADFVDPEFLTPMRALNQSVFEGQRGKLEFRIRTLQGEQRWLSTVAVPLRDAEGTIIAHLGVTHDVTERQEHLDRIRHLAFFDPLTGLPNRRLLGDRLRHALRQAVRYQRSLAVLFLDLDRFKDVNDTLGHDVGDALLQAVAGRLAACMRRGDTIARQGGDEFIAILTEIAQPGDAATVAEKILAALTDPVEVCGHVLTISTSIGIAVFPIDGEDDVGELLRKADRAMYAAKEAGRGTYRFSSPPPADRGTSAA